MDPGTAAVRQGHDKAGQDSIREDSSNTRRTPDGSSWNIQSREPVYRPEEARREGVRNRGGSAPLLPGTPSDRRVAGTDVKKPAKKQDGTSGRGASWEAEYTALADEIQVRHYSPKTLRAYGSWMRKFQAFTKSKAPSSLSTRDVKEFLSFLAVKRKVSASTQNQAFNALLFFFRHVLGKEFERSKALSGKSANLAFPWCCPDGR